MQVTDRVDYEFNAAAAAFVPARLASVVKAKAANRLQAEVVKDDLIEAVKQQTVQPDPERESVNASEEMHDGIGDLPVQGMYLVMLGTRTSVFWVLGTWWMAPCICTCAGYAVGCI